MKAQYRRKMGSVEKHYGAEGLLEIILAALERQGHDLEALQPADLAAVDEFHVRGREATLELAARAQLEPGVRVLDLGSGLGGSARLLAAEGSCEVVGVDLTQEYVEVATALTELVGLGSRVRFRHASALDLPLDRDSFDAVWTEHVQMNVVDKRRFYSEAARVLKPGGALIFHDLFLGSGQALRYPVPWAQDESISHLWSVERVRETLRDLGFEVEAWSDTSELSLKWFEKMAARRAESAPAPLGIHLLMGATAAQKLQNLTHNLREGKVVLLQAVLRKLGEGLSSG